MCHSARGPDLTLPNIGQQLGDIRIQRIRSFQKCSLGEIPPNEFIAFWSWSSYDLCWWSSMIFEKKKKKKTCKTKKLCNHLIKVKHYVLRFSKNFMSLPWRSMVVHLAPIPFTSYFHYDHFTRLKNNSKKEAGPCFAKSRNTGIYMFSCPPGCFTPHRNGQGHPMPPSGWETSGSNRIRLSGPKVFEDLLRWWIFFEMTFRTSLFCLKRVSFSVHIVEGCFRLLYFS